jgi:hypothetical protein
LREQVERVQDHILEELDWIQSHSAQDKDFSYHYQLLRIKTNRHTGTKDKEVYVADN